MSGEEVGNALGMSDEDFSKMVMPEEPPQERTAESEPEAVIEEPATEQEQVIDDESEQEVKLETEESDTIEEESTDSVDDTGSEDDQITDPVDVDNKSEPEEDPSDPEKKDTSPEDTIDYKAEYQALFAPLKANGKMMNVASIEDARKLMQMGANYPLKMAAIKPKFKQLKLLEKNGIETEEDLAYLIDLKNNNPKAINKLLKESKIDPLSIDLEKDTEYTPNSYTVDDKEVELDAVLDEIRATDTYETTIDTVGNKWDDSSRKMILEHPSILRIINDHVSSGVFEKITSELQYERSLGRLGDLSDLEAYKKIGDAIQARGGFTPESTPAAAEAALKIQDPVIKPSEDPKLKDRKRAASGVKTASKSKPKKLDFNPLAMSDEEFEKAVAGNPTFLNI